MIAKAAGVLVLLGVVGWICLVLYVAEKLADAGVADGWVRR